MACERDFGFCGVLTLRKKTTAQKRHEMCEKKKKKNRTKNLFFLSLSSGCWCVTSERERVSNTKNDDETNADDDEKQRCFEFVDK
jgi:hypothetical protein